MSKVLIIFLLTVFIAIIFFGKGEISLCSMLEDDNITCSKCEELRPCIMCKVFESGQLNKTVCDEECHHVSIGTIRDHKDGVSASRYHDCQLVDHSDDCTFYFRYIYEKSSNDVNRVIANAKKECSPPTQ